MSLSFSVRPALSDDLGPIHAIQCNSYPPSHHESLEVFSCIISQRISLVATDGEGCIIGYCLVQWLDSPKAPPPLNQPIELPSDTRAREHAFIHDCSVSEAYRSKGVASRLVEGVIERYRGAKALSLTLIALDASSAAYWQHKGFSPMVTSMKRPNKSVESYGPGALHLEFVESIRKDDPKIDRCLDTISASFTRDQSTGSDFYAGPHPEAHHRFWRLLAEDCLSASSEDEKPMMLLRGGEAAAMCVLWLPPRSPWNVKDASYWSLLTQEGRECFDACHSKSGEWYNACLSLYQRQGPFYSLEFLACIESSQGKGLASTLMSAITTRADAEGRFVFLVAMSSRLMAWYSSRFGFVPTKQSTFRRRFDGAMFETNLFYMERAPGFDGPLAANSRSSDRHIVNLARSDRLIMSIQYVSQEEIEAHEAAMQRVVEVEKKEREEIDKKKKRAVKAADDTFKKKIKASEAKMRKAIEAAERANNKAVEAAKEEADDQIQAAEAIAKQKQKQLDYAEKKLAAMQRDFECLPLLRQVYHEAPEEVFELIVSKCSDAAADDGDGRGGLNAFRLANKRLKQVVESCTTRLTNQQREDGPELLPVPIFQRCRTIVEIRCDSRNLRSLEGCPDGLKMLFTCSSQISDLSPLASCSMMKSLDIRDSSVTDISVVSSIPLLETFACEKSQGMPSIKDLAPLSSRPLLKKLDLYGNRELKDLFPLSACTALEFLNISNCPLITSPSPLSACTSLETLAICGCPLITSLSPLSACTALENVNISRCPLISSLASLSALIKLRTLNCLHIGPLTSLLPLTSCKGLGRVYCNRNAVDLEELKRRRPELRIFDIE